MPAEEPEVKRAVSFFDGQNLYRHAKEAFGHHHPNYDPKKLTDAVTAVRHQPGYGPDRFRHELVPKHTLDELRNNNMLEHWNL